MDWARILAYVTGTVDQELLARIEYLAAENRILKAQLKGRLKLSDSERATLGEIGHRLGRKVLGEVANVAGPDTILAWYDPFILANAASDDMGATVHLRLRLVRVASIKGRENLITVAVGQHAGAVNVFLVA